MYGVALLILTLLFFLSFDAISDFPAILMCLLSLLVSFVLLEVFRAIIISQLGEKTKIEAQMEPLNAAPDERQYRNRFVSAAIDTVLSPIIIIDSGGRAIAVNKAAHARFSQVKLGEKIDFFIRNPSLLAAIDKSQTDRIPVQTNIETFFPDAKYDKVDISTFEIDGRRRTIIIFVDETDLRRTEQMRVDFLANAGHELRTPLASIRGFLETLSDTASNDKAAFDKFLPIMSREADRMNRLIEDILSLSKIEMNEHVAPKTLINPFEALEYALDATESQVKTGQINLSNTKCDCDIYGDNDELQQVFLNLIENAIKYGDENQNINLETFCNLEYSQLNQFTNRKWENSVGLALLMPNDNNLKYCVFRIENFGNGIKGKYMPRLSERFYRIDDERAHIRGTGLGLAIVKHILRRHRAGFYVESDEKNKVAFSIALPIA